MRLQHFQQLQIQKTLTAQYIMPYFFVRKSHYGFLTTIVLYELWPMLSVMNTIDIRGTISTTSELKYE